MKTDKRHYLGWGSRLRLLARVLGITAVFVALAGAFVLWAMLRELSVNRIQESLQATGTVFVASAAVVIGAGVAAAVLLLEALVWLGGSVRQSASSANAAVQVVLAVAVFGLVNVLGFNHFKRWDLTRDQQFTLPTKMADELQKLQGKTTIVVLQQHKTFGQLSAKPDIYDYAAERKVVDKVKDLVAQFRLLGPQFRVVALDVESKQYAQQLDDETASRPGLKEAIAAAPDNSIFFYPDDQVETLTADEVRRRMAAGRRVASLADGKDTTRVLAYEGNIPRLSFNEFYQLDKTASREANPGPDGKPMGNLVLRPQGVDSFARRVLAVQEKRPKVGLLVIHQLLASALDTSDRNVYSAAGLRRALEDHGFEVVDVVIKKWGEPGGPKPAAYNLSETGFERLEALLEGYEEDRRDLLESRKQIEASQKLFREKSLEELSRLFRQRLRRDVTEEDREIQTRGLGEAMRQIDERLAELAVEAKDTEAQLTALLRNERSFEDRRVADVQKKLERLTDDCDLLIIPRWTVMSASVADETIAPELYRLEAKQAEVVKNFMTKGKPVLVCASPNIEPNVPAPSEPLDDLERLLADRGIHLGREAIITMAEAKSFAARRSGDRFGSTATVLPPVTFPAPKVNGRDNPIAAAMRATAASADQRLDIQASSPRPVYLVPGLEEKLPFPAEFLLSPAASWNEENPMVVRNLGAGRVAQIPPRFRPTPVEDPKKGTRDEVRRGPFPIGVAIETPVPREWLEKEYAESRGVVAVANPLLGSLAAVGLTAEAVLPPKQADSPVPPRPERKTSRLVVIGHGGLFTGKQLNPAHEQLLLHTCNWLLGRDERLPRTEAEWSYPRIQRDERDAFLWKYGPAIGLPAAFLYLGLMVWIVRRVR